MVEGIRGYAHDEVVAQSLGALQETDVTIMKQVVSTVCDDFNHKLLYLESSLYLIIYIIATPL